MAIMTGQPVENTRTDGKLEPGQHGPVSSGGRNAVYVSGNILHAVACMICATGLGSRRCRGHAAMHGCGNGLYCMHNSTRMHHIRSELLGLNLVVHLSLQLLRLHLNLHLVLGLETVIKQQQYTTYIINKLEGRKAKRRTIWDDKDAAMAII